MPRYASRVPTRGEKRSACSTSGGNARSFALIDAVHGGAQVERDRGRVAHRVQTRVHTPLHGASQ
jgi:hypothetical protein